MVKPRFAKEIRNHEKIERVFVTEVINPSVCSKSSLKKVRKMLKGVVEKGTATNLQSSNFKIAGKTGTTRTGSLLASYNDEIASAIWMGYEKPIAEGDPKAVGAVAAFQRFMDKLLGHRSDLLSI